MPHKIKIKQKTNKNQNATYESQISVFKLKIQTTITR